FPSLRFASSVSSRLRASSILMEAVQAASFFLSARTCAAQHTSTPTSTKGPNVFHFFRMKFSNLRELNFRTALLPQNCPSTRGHGFGNLALVEGHFLTGPQSHNVVTISGI